MAEYEVAARLLPRLLQERPPRARVMSVLAGLVTVGGLVMAHILAANRGDGYTGVLLILDHLFTLALVVAVFTIAAGVGGRLVKAGGLTMDGPVEALLFWTAVGLGALATAVLGVGLFFGLLPVGLFVLMAGAAVLVRNEIRELPALVTGTFSCLRARADGFSLLIFFLIALFLITGSLAPPTDCDALMYHLRVPQQFLQAGSIYRPEDNAHFAYVGLPHMLYLPLLALGSPAGPAVVSALCTLWVVLTRAQKRTAAVTLILGLAVTTALPWLLKNALFLGDPVYPFLGGPRLDPWIARIYGGAALPPQVDPNWVWHAQRPFNLVDLFVSPGRIAFEGGGVFYRPNLLLLLVPLWLLFLKNKVLTWLAGPALAYVVVVVRLQPTTSLRYLIPAIAPLTLVVLYCYGQAWDRFLSPGRVRALLSATTLFVLASPALFVYGRMTKGRQLAHTFGLVSRRAFLETWTRDYPAVVSFVNARLPTQSRILMLFESRGYYFRVPVLQDNGGLNWPLLSAKAAGPDCLRSAGITHVLVNTAALAGFARAGRDLAPLRLDLLQRFAERCLSPIYSAGEFSIFRVHPGMGRGGE